MPDPATVRQAARELAVSTATVRRWIRDGAPCVRPGGHGPGQGALVIVADVERWRRKDDVLERVAAALVDTLRRDGGEGEPAHRTLGIRLPAAAVLLACAYERIHRAITGRDAETLPAEIERCVRDLANSRP